MWGKKKGGDRIRLEAYWHNWPDWQDCRKEYRSIELIQLGLNLDSGEYLKHLSISWR